MFAGSEDGVDKMKTYQAVHYKLRVLKNNLKIGEIKSDPFMQNVNKKLNPALTLRDSNFDKVKENKVKALIHVTLMHPSKLVDFLIKMFDLEEITRFLIPHYRASSVKSKFVYA